MFHRFESIHRKKKAALETFEVVAFVSCSITAGKIRP